MVRLRIDLPPDNSRVGSVKYEHGTGMINILRDREIVKSPTNIVPAVVEAHFSEIVDGYRSGSYRITTQGAMVGGLMYFSATNSKSFAFMEDREAYSNDECSWEKGHDTAGSSK
jgi:hypothetical protein